MYRIPLPWTDMHLLLAPRWSELPGPAQVGLLALLCVVPVALILWLYRSELRLVAPATARRLLLLRLFVLFVLLFLVGLQPILARITTEELPGRVLVAVDRSDSMDIADPQRPAVDKLRLARALKLADDLCSEAQLNDWIRQHEENKEGPQWAASDEGRRQHDRVCQRIDALTRSQAGQRVLSPDGVRLLPAITKKHQVDLLGFAQEAWDVKPDQWEELFRPQSMTEDNGHQTDLRWPLVRALERSGPDQGKILGVVLLTDGQHNWGPSPVKKAIELGEHQLPIFPVALGTREPPPDIAVASVKAPPTVFKDVDAAVEVRVKVSGLRQPQELELEVRRPGEKAPLQTRTLRHDGTDRYYTERLQVRLDQAGTQTLTVSVRSKSEDAKETRSDNNSRPVVINVADDKAKVLLVDGEARWEYHYLATVLQRDRTMQPQSVVFVQPRLGKISEEDLLKVGNPRLTLPTEPDAFAAYDCIILGDVSPEHLPLSERVRLEKYVADRGGTLVILAGKRFMPLAFPQTASAGRETAESEGDPLFKLLPVEQPRIVKPEDGFPVTLTQEGKLTPFLQMEPEPDKNETRWAELPRHFWAVIGKAKPGAVPLAYFAHEGPAAGKKSAVEREKEQALIVRHNYGFGRVLFVGLDSTWRWRYKEGDTYHHRFWGQTIRWAASDKPLVTGNENVRFGTREPVYRQGQEVEVVVRLAEETLKLRSDALAGARLLRSTNGGGEEAVALVPLARREAQPRVLEGRVRDLPQGVYHVELVIPELADKLNGPPGPDGRPVKLRGTFTVTPPDSEEMVELATNWTLLEELAARSGGKVFTAENAAELVDLLNKRAVTREERIENRLWQWWLTLLLVLALLTAEWVGRKWAGLP